MNPTIEKFGWPATLPSVSVGAGASPGPGAGTGRSMGSSGRERPWATIARMP